MHLLVPKNAIKFFAKDLLIKHPGLCSCLLLTGLPCHYNAYLSLRAFCSSESLLILTSSKRSHLIHDISSIMTDRSVSVLKCNASEETKLFANAYQ